MKILQSPQFSHLVDTLSLSVSQSGFVTTDETWHQSPLPAASSRLYFVTEGSGMLISDSESMPLVPGYAYLAPVGMLCSL